jgi:hypothetical protein
MAKPTTADEWQNTIVAFESPHKLRELCIAQEEDRASQELAVEQQTFKIRLANTDDRLESSSLLINKRYSWRGYSTEAGKLEHPNRITLIANANDHIVGTMTLCFDSQVGLPADEIYSDKLNLLRQEGRKLCEPTQLAIDESVRSKRVFASLIHISFIYAYNIHGYTDYVIEVNPRHAMFYKKMLGFKEFGEERVCARVNAPALLLRLELDYMREQIERFGGRLEQAQSEKSFYPYFFTKKDEIGITNRLFSNEP